MQDPLSSVPHQTFQSHRAGHLQSPAHPSLPPRPPAPAASSAEIAAATVFAAPQLRDFKKEATAFIPTSLKRKKAGNASVSASSSKIDAAPSLETDSASGADADEAPAARPDLLSTLKGQFGPAPTVASRVPATSGKAKAEAKKKDDYEKFVEEMGDILGSS